MLSMENKLTSKKNYRLVLIAYFLIWIISPILCSSSFPLDVPEGIYWGKEFQLGYYKHPPLSSWILYSFYYIFGQFGPYLLSQICIVITMYFVYLLAKKLVSEEKAVLSSCLLLGIFYYTWPSLEFNHNIAQMPIWAGLVYLFYLVLQKNTWLLWGAFGLVMGIGMLTKYSVAILIISMVIFSLVTPYRYLWLSAKPWVAVCIALIVFSPHFIWLYQNDWLTIHYIQERSHEDGDVKDRIGALKFLVTQFINFLPLLVIFACAKCLKFKKIIIKRTDWVFLIFLGLFPAISLFLLGLTTGLTIKDMWASPMWCLVPLIFISLIPDDVFIIKKHILWYGLCIWLIVITALMTVYVQFGGQIRNKPSRMDWPQVQLSENIEQQWNSKSICKLDTIGGDNWLAILSATAMKKMPSVYMSTSANYSKWIDLDRVSTQGTVMLWEKGKRPTLPYFSELTMNTQLVIYNGEWKFFWHKVPNKEPLEVEWYLFVPKQCLK